MRKLIMKMSISIDGFVSGPNGGNDWVFKTGDAESLAWSVGSASQAGRRVSSTAILPKGCMNASCCFAKLSKIC